MSLVYRAIWQDNRADLVPEALTAFTRWVSSEYGLDVPPEGDVEQTVDGVDGSTRVSASTAQAASDDASAAMATLRTDDGSERRVTTLRAIVRGDEQWLWVDVERVAADIWDRTPPEAPQLVRDLVDAGCAANGDPRWGVVRLTSRARAADPSRLDATCLNLLRSAQRESPVVIFAHDYAADPKTNMARANAAAAQLVGIAPVVLIPGPGLSDFNQAVGEEKQLLPGQARVFGPDPDNPDQHRLIEAGFVRRYPDQVGRLICAGLVQALAARRAPSAYDDIRRMFRNTSQRSANELLGEYEAELSARETEIAHLHSVITILEGEKLSALEEIESLQEQRTKLQDAVVQLLHPNGGGERALGEPETVADAIEMANVLDGVVVADGAARDIDKLDRSVESRAWARTIWSGLLALNAYALEAGRFRGSFYEWCRNSDHRLSWPTAQKKLAMSESESVLSVERLRKQRMLPIDWRVAAEGRILMQAHLKISSGSLAPRVYFHDDTGGVTGKVHVGFIGPHEHMPTKRNN